MAVGEILAKGLVVIKGDTSHARAEVAKLSAEEQKAAKARIKAQEEHNAALERSNQRFQLYAAGAVAGWAIISKSVKTYEDHLKSMGASGEADLRRIQGATKALDGAQKNLEIAIGKVAAAAIPAANALADMANELANIVSGIGDVVRAASNLPGGGYLGKGLGIAMKYGGPVNQARALGSLAVTGIGSVYDNIRGTASVSDNFSSIDGPSDVNQYLYGKDAQAGWSRLTGKSSNTQSLLGEEGKQAIQYIDQESGRLLARSLKGKAELFFKNAGRGLGLVESNRAGGGGGRGGSRGAKTDPYAEASASIFGDIAATSGSSSGRYSQDALSQLGLAGRFLGGTTIDSDVAEALGGGRNVWQGVEVPQSVLDSLDELLAKLPSKEESLLHRIFGTPDEIDAQAEAIDYAMSAMNSLAEAGTATMQAWIEGGKSLSDVFRSVIADGLAAIAGDLAGKATRHIVEGAAHLVLGSPKAAQHFGAAAIYGAGAIAVGAAAKGIHPSAKTPGAGRGNSYAAAGLGGGGGGEPARNANLTVVMGDGFADDSPRYKARRVRRAINQARNLYPESGATEPN